MIQSCALKLRMPFLDQKGGGESCENEAHAKGNHMSDPIVNDVHDPIPDLNPNQPHPAKKIKIK